MKINVSFSLLLLACVCFIDAQEECTWDSVINLDKRYENFLKLIESEGGTELKIENLQTVFEHASQKGSECFLATLQDIDKFLTKFHQDVSALLESQATQTTESSGNEDGELKKAYVEFVMQMVPPNKEGSPLQRLVNMVILLDKIAAFRKSEVIVNDVNEMKEKLASGCKAALPCMTDSIKEEQPDQFDKLMAIWQKSSGSQ